LEERLKALQNDASRVSQTVSLNNEQKRLLKEILENPEKNKGNKSYEL
jgi:hypothetical protein